MRVFFFVLLKKNPLTVLLLWTYLCKAAAPYCLLSGLLICVCWVCVLNYMYAYTCHEYLFYFYIFEAYSGNKAECKLIFVFVFFFGFVIKFYIFYHFYMVLINALRHITDINATWNFYLQEAEGFQQQCAVILELMRSVLNKLGFYCNCDTPILFRGILK